MTAPEAASIRGAKFPTEYGTPRVEDLLPWSDAEERLRAAPNYWIASVTPSGEPHVRPVDGVWVDGALCFGGSPQTRWVRNLSANPAISVHLGGHNEVLILEGTAELVSDPDHPLAAVCSKATVAKYPQYYPGGETPFRPFWAFRPSRAYAWSLDKFPNGATRWQFDR